MYSLWAIDWPATVCSGQHAIVHVDEPGSIGEYIGGLTIESRDTLAVLYFWRIGGWMPILRSIGTLDQIVTEDLMHPVFTCVGAAMHVVPAARQLAHLEIA